MEQTQYAEILSLAHLVLNGKVPAIYVYFLRNSLLIYFTHAKIMLSSRLLIYIKAHHKINIVREK